MCACGGALARSGGLVAGAAGTGVVILASLGAAVSCTSAVAVIMAVAVVVIVFGVVWVRWI